LDQEPGSVPRDRYTRAHLGNRRAACGALCRRIREDSHLTE
jgi:hypothetical protein